MWVSDLDDPQPECTGLITQPEARNVCAYISVSSQMILKLLVITLSEPPFFA